MQKAKTVSAYQQQKLDDERKEYPCGILHSSIEEAMVHAERSLGFRDEQGKLVGRLEPVLGGTTYTSGTVIGWQRGTRKRFRVDFDPDFAAKNVEASEKKNSVNKGTQGVHVNEENFDDTRRTKICHPTQASLRQADLLWRRWTSRYGFVGQVTKEVVEEIDR